jgi:hypothetical protein
MSVLFRNIPTREEDGTWGYTRFETKEDFRDFVKSLYKEPGKYGFDEYAHEFNREATTFLSKGMYCDSPRMSRDYIEYWDTQRERCRKGVIIKGKEGKIWYLPRFYYHWLNFLQIYNTVHTRFEFPGIRDVQYHMALYEVLAELHGLNIAIVKKRQMASSYFHIAKLYNKYIFEEGFVAKIGASDKKYIDATNGCWKFLSQYHNFTNKNTAWACGNFPDKVFSWQQKVETKTPDGRKVEIGTMATIAGISFDKDPVSGVGGACNEMFYEEGGVAPTAHITYGYMRSAMRQGTTVTGVFTIAGSVGDLAQCEPLKEFIMNPEVNGFYAIDTDLIDENGTTGKTGLFIPEQWSLTGEGELNFTDEFGNSKVEEALVYLDKEFERMRLTMSPEKYQLEISQRPRNLKEAFAMRTISVFPVQHTASQIRRIEENEYAMEYVDLIRTAKNEIETVPSDRRPIKEFPLPMKTEDKRSVVCIHKHPIKDAPHGTYICAIDPVEVGKTTTSASLASIVVYEMDIQVITEEVYKKAPPLGKEGVEITTDEWGAIKPKRKEDNKLEVKTSSHIEGGKIVAFWCGRFDDPNETNEYISRLIEYYNARALCENNKPGFINYMISKKRQKYLVYRDEMTFDKEQDLVKKGYQKYGITMTPRLWKVLLEDAINSLSEVLHEERDEEGNVTMIHYGVERITDIMILKEMQIYQQGLNVDRLVSYSLLISYVKILQAAGRMRKRKVERSDDKLENPSKMVTFKGGDRPMFKNIGRQSNGNMIKFKRNPFRNIR